MTSMLPEEENKTKLKLKLINDNNMKEETRSFLSFSRENLSISHSDLEKGFNRNRLRTGRNTILSTVAIFIALLCLGLEAWRLHCSLVNTREIEELKRDVESMKHRFLEKDLLDELKAFEEQLYSKGSNDDEDPGEDDIDAGDYDFNYDDDSSSSYEYFGDYPASSTYGTKTSDFTEETYGSRPSDFPDSSSTIKPVPSPPEASSKKAFLELLTALRKVEAKRGQEFEKSVREGHKNVERERLEEHKKRTSHEDKIEEEISGKGKRDLVKGHGNMERPLSSIPEVNQEDNYKRKRSITDDVAHTSGEVITASTNSRAAKNQTRRIAAKRRSRGNAGSTTTEGSETSINDWDRHPPKKYYAHARPDNIRSLPSTNDDDLSGQIMKSRKPPIGGSQRDVNQEDDQDTSQELAEYRKVLPGGSQKRRAMTRRHLRAPRQVYAIHYGADSTLFSEEDEHTGNGRAKHNNGVFKAWKPSDWVSDLGMNRYFTLAADGRLTVHETGLYLVYAQIHYLDEHDENGFHVLVNGRPILQCMVYSPGIGHKSRSCFSSQVTLLQSGDHLILKDVGSARYTLFQHDKSFFGLAKLGEPRQQQKHSTTPMTQL